MDERPMGGRLRRSAWIVVALGAVLAALGGAAAWAVGSGGGTTGKVDFSTSQVVMETPSASWQEVTSMDVTTASGPLVVRFDAQAYVDDYDSNAQFVGTAYAATLVRVLVDGVAVQPNAVRFTTNEGKRNINDHNGQSASFSWAGTATTGNHTITVQFRSLTKFDISGFVRWTLTVDHG